MTPLTVVWFRDDLRLADHPALAAAAAAGPVVALYVRETGAGRPPGGAARWWLAGSLDAHRAALARHGVALVLRSGRARDVVPAVAAAARAGRVVALRRHEPAAATEDAAVGDRLNAAGVGFELFDGALLHDPARLRTGAGEPFRVFTPFWRALLAAGPPRRPLPEPERIAPGPAVASEDAAGWTLRPTRPDWAGGLAAAWRPGEAAAAARLAAFVEHEFAGYAAGRDVPAAAATSRLSPHLRFGEISPAQVFHAVTARMAAGGPPGLGRSGDKFLAELGWREFSWHLLAARPDLAEAPLQPRFHAMPWREVPAELEAWRRGRTGVPIVDAAMRGLWRDGYMHNRLRMVVASFLAKHLMIDWREGERWFWDTLVDADAASNPAGWQWTAGCGADAAPYFRVFNPVLQGEKFDPRGTFVRAHVPELAALPDARVHAPWTASPIELRAAGVDLGATYPAPIVDLAAGRARALAAFEVVKAAP